MMKSETISCIVTGITKRVSGITIERKSLKFGNLDQFKEHFICNEAKKLLRQRVPPDEVQKRLLPSGTKPFSINLHALARLKLLKKNRKGKEELTPEEQLKREEESNTKLREWHFRQEEFSSNRKAWIEEVTGGPNKCQVPYGGTCIRPDVYYDNEGNKEGRCSPCPYVQYCLCTNKNAK
jgi:hypothetical protein